MPSVCINDIIPFDFTDAPVSVRRSEPGPFMVRIMGNWHKRNTAFARVGKIVYHGPDPLEALAVVEEYAGEKIDVTNLPASVARFFTRESK